MGRVKSFKARAKEFRDKVIQLAKELQVEINIGYLDPSHDEDLIISDTKSQEEVYFATLNKEEK